MIQRELEQSRFNDRDSILDVLAILVFGSDGPYWLDDLLPADADLGPYAQVASDHETPIAFVPLRLYLPRPTSAMIPRWMVGSCNVEVGVMSVLIGGEAARVETTGEWHLIDDLAAVLSLDEDRRPAAWRSCLSCDRDSRNRDDESIVYVPVAISLPRLAADLPVSLGRRLAGVGSFDFGHVRPHVVGGSDPLDVASDSVKYGIVRSDVRAVAD